MFGTELDVISRCMFHVAWKRFVLRLIFLIKKHTNLSLNLTEGSENCITESFVNVILKYTYTDQVKEEEMGGACSKNAREQ
jgi:hypothetical protein